MKRRAFITLLGGAAAWPLNAHAQQSGPIRRIGVLLYGSESEPDAKSQFAAFTSALSRAGWTAGNNLHMEVRWAAGDIKKTQLFAKELVGLAPDLIFTAATPAATAVHSETQTIPTVFVLVVDPVERGLAKSVARPGGNITGVLPFEPSLGGKWLDLLTKIAPAVKRFDFMFNPNTAPYAKSYFLPELERAAQALNVQSTSVLVQSETEIEAAIASLGADPRGGLVVVPDSFMLVNRAKIIALAAQNKVPAVYFEPGFAAQGGLVAYGPDFKVLFDLAAGYVDRILRGAKPSDLPIELPTKFQFVINQRTANAIGLSIPPTLLAEADQVLE